MNIQLDKQDNGTAYIAVTVEPADYDEKVAKELKKLRKEANIPGFRPGMVPQSLINKKFRKNVMAEETYRTSYDLAADYFKKEGIEVVGDMIPSEKQGTLDFDNGTSFEYCYKIGIAPEVKVELSSKDKVKKPVIKATDEMIKNYSENFLRRFAEFKDVDEISSDEMLTINLQNEDMKIEDANLSLVSLSEEKRKEYSGKKVSDKVKVNIEELYPGKKQRAAILSLKEEELDSVKPDFELEITKIQKLTNPELDADLFDKAFPEKDVTTVEQFNEKMTSELNNMLNSQTKWGFWNSIREYILNKVNISLPDEFLKEWLFLINEGKFTHEDIEKEYPKFQKMLAWDLVQKTIVKDNGLKIDQDLLKTEAKNAVLEQYRYYGINNIPEEELESIANDMLKDKEQAKNILEQATERIIMDTILTKISVSEKEMTPDEYAESQKKDAE